jgi:hypothetical protein
MLFIYVFVAVYYVYSPGKVFYSPGKVFLFLLSLIDEFNINFEGFYALDKEEIGAYII